MIKELMILTLVSSFAFATENSSHLVKKEVKMAKPKKIDSPFLINGKMPHLTKLVMKHWDDLNLTKEQKDSLKKVREETMGAIKELKPQIIKLENEIAQETLIGSKPDSLKQKVDMVAKLKAEATITHIKCIYNTKRILNQDQLKLLIK